ncbi:MAG: MoxR family ATPase, partial [Pseudomonadota bacterium]
MHNIKAGKTYHIKFGGDGAPVAHIFEEREVHAIQAAYAARRPLLVRGEPGVGKSQLAKAAAVATGRAFVQKVVNIRSEPQDLLWIDDPIARLADAQLINAVSGYMTGGRRARDLRKKINDRTSYFEPGVFWWAFDWNSAKKQTAEPEQPEGCKPSNGVVVLIDEIDKAETDLPNGLLEVLGTRSFMPDFFDKPISAPKDRWPMVVITTNEERELPAAFMRRCVVLNVALPKDPERLEAFLIERGKAHMGTRLHESAIEMAAEQLRLARTEAVEKHTRLLPGQAEFIDLLNAVAKLEPCKQSDRQIARMEQIKQFFLEKSKRDVE